MMIIMGIVGTFFAIVVIGKKTKKKQKQNLMLDGT
jgi:hypothetical protein